MPHKVRIVTCLLTMACGVFAADNAVPSGDAASWASVGGVLTAVGVVWHKALARIQRR